MLASEKLYEKLKDIVNDDSLLIDTVSDDPLVLAFETGKATGRLELANEVWKDWFGEWPFPSVNGQQTPQSKALQSDKGLHRPEPINLTDIKDALL